MVFTTRVVPLFVILEVLMQSVMFWPKRHSEGDIQWGASGKNGTCHGSVKAIDGKHIPQLIRVRETDTNSALGCCGGYFLVIGFVPENQ